MASENQFYVNTLQSLKEQVLFGMNLVRTLSGDSQSYGHNIMHQHAVIVEAIIVGNVDAARSGMRQHLEETRRRLMGVAGASIA